MTGAVADTRLGGAPFISDLVLLMSSDSHGTGTGPVSPLATTGGPDCWEGDFSELIQRRQVIDVALTPTQSRVLAAIVDDGCMTYAEVAKVCRMRICEVTVHVTRIARKIRKKRKPQDMRVARTVPAARAAIVC